MKKPGYYSSGEFARMAHVTLRTIRYYDKQNILKPSYVTEAGARFYTDEDFARLQQILLLKYLGFSLDDIRDMTIDDADYHFMLNSLNIQLKLVRDRIEQMQLVEQAIQDTSDLIKKEHSIDWSQMLNLIHLTGMEKSMKNQYQDASNISARINLHSLYSQNTKGWFPWIFEQLELKPGMKVLELGCGTGTVTEMLADAGYDMIGIDNSEEMLAEAMEKRAESGHDILYLLQDMREFELYGTVRAVISVCDSVNYITEPDELQEVFRLVNNYLDPKGVFVFDFNTRYKYEEILGDRTIAENREDCSFIWENYYDPEEEINEYDLTIFVQEEGDTFHRFTETHLQRGYTVGQMRTLVEQAGLKILEIMDSDTGEAVSETSERVYIVAKEQQKEL